MRAGDNVFAGATPSGLRLLGGIRNVDACVRCHGGERGDLLGAFTYTLRRNENQELHLVGLAVSLARRKPQ